MTTTIDLNAIKARQQKTWTSGDYAAIAARIHPIAERLVEAADLSTVDRVLDVATGTGNAAIAAARSGATVIGIDYVPELLAKARARAAAEGLPVEFAEGDAEQLAFPDASFDVVLSCVGVMFAPDQERAAAELLRVCRPGGTIGLVAWTPDGFIGELFRIVGRYVPPPAALRPPAEWGTEQRLRELLGSGISELQTRSLDAVLRFASPQDFADVFRENYGPTLKAFEALDEERGALFYDDLAALAARYNVADDGTVKMPWTYLEAGARRAGDPT
jgi:SAM-dependent methyltransferase